jgi:hypothetical protein
VDTFQQGDFSLPIRSRFCRSPAGNILDCAICAIRHLTGWRSAGDPAANREVLTIEDEPDPDWQMLMVTDFATKYAGSPFLRYLYLFGARAADEKGESVKAADFCKKIKKVVERWGCLNAASPPHPDFEDRLIVLQGEMNSLQRSTLLIER